MESDEPDITAAFDSDNPSSSDVPNEDDEVGYISPGSFSRGGHYGRKHSKNAYLPRRICQTN